MIDKRRFKDVGNSLEEFAYEFLVVCPNCSKQCKVLLDGISDTNKLFQPRKAICIHCGFAKKWNGDKISAGEPYDWYFGFPLWLQISCRDEILWALNADHLDFLEDYVSAKQREQLPNKNRSLISRLPVWVKSAKNRGEILKCIQKLREKLQRLNK